MNKISLEQFYADSPPTVVQLAIKPHFDALTEQQKLYAHHISRAAFNGTRIVLRQVSPESESIFDLILALYGGCGGKWKQLQSDTEISDQELQYFLQYAAQFLHNNGNYKGFGDSKFIPRLPSPSLTALVSTTPTAKELLDSIGHDGIFGNVGQPGLMHLGFPDHGHLSSYYPDSPTIKEEEIILIGGFLAKKGLLPENTRLRKLQNGSFQVLVASEVENPPGDSVDVGDTTSWELEGELQGKRLEIVYGDHQQEMAKISLHMKKAEHSAANDRQKKMMEEYAKSFTTGSLLAFKESQKLWVEDKGPLVESNIGFIETYRDPAGVRAEWEGLVAMVNKERTRAFTKLVDAAPSMIPKLPWGKDFEKDEFTAPDFTSIEVLAWAGSGIPAGINIPNYDDIRQEIGFKNVSLGNVLSAQAPNESIPFVHSDDLAVYQKNRDGAFEVQVGIHELLGHGTGKLLQETSPGVYNFPINHPPVSPITSQPINTYYKPGETWSSVFGAMSSSYEECRAECVAMALSCDFSILQIFGFGDGTEDLNGPAGDLLHSSYLSMARAGITALEFWDPKTSKWGQAHMQARYSILKVFLAAGQGFVKLEYSTDYLSDLTVRVDRNKILSVGRPAVEAYLQKLHVYKCSADVEAARKLYEELTAVTDEFWGGKLRNLVLQKKSPRKVFVQANTMIDGDQVVLKEYDASLEGVIQSWAERGV